MRRFLYVTDDATRIPVFIVTPDGELDGCHGVFRAAGFDVNHHRTLLVTDLTRPRTENDPFQWRNTNTTLFAFHQTMLEDHDEWRRVLFLPDGSEVNVAEWRRRLLAMDGAA